MRRVLGVLVVLAALAGMPAHAASQQVVVAGFQFIPSGYVTADPFNMAGGAVALPAGAPTVNRGDDLVFTFVDPTKHTVTKVSGGSSWTALVNTGPGTTATLHISTSFVKGTYVYMCAIHTGMRGSFIVA